MSTGLTKTEVARIATLARLELTEEEKELYTQQLAAILAYADEVRRVDTSGVPATSHILARRTPERSDRVGSSLSRNNALANAPDPASDAGLFRVPRVIG